MAEYYININGQQLGPFPANKLVSNGATADTMVWTPGMPSWELAKNVPELAPLFPAPSPPRLINSPRISNRHISSRRTSSRNHSSIISSRSSISNARSMPRRAARSQPSNALCPTPTWCGASSAWCSAVCPSV